MKRRAALGAVAVLTLGGAACGIPTGGGPTAIPKSNVPYHLLAPATTTTSSATPPAVGVPEPVFLVAPTGHLVAVTRDVPVPAALTQIVTALLDGPSQAESQAGLVSYLTGSPTTVTATVANGVATLDFRSNPIQVVGPSQTLAIAQIVYTATQQPGVTGVSFRIAGQNIEVPTASGVQVTGPVGRDAYLPQAPLP